MKIVKMSYIYIAALFLTVISCKSRQGDLFIISPQTFADNKITLAEIADDIKYVPLDNTFPIAVTFGLKINDYSIYLSVKDIGIVQFDRNGSFIRKIGNIGRGPGEYQGMSFTVDEDNKRIYVLDKNRINVYSYSGSFLRDFPYKEYISGGAGGIELFNNLLFIPDYIHYPNAKFNWIFLDTLGNLVFQKKNSVVPNKSVQPLKGSFYRFGNRLFYFNVINDTIFSITPDFKDRAAYLFSNDTSRRPVDGFSVIPQLNNLFRTGIMFETSNFIFLDYGYQDKAAILIINKKTKKTFLAYQDEKVFNKLVHTIPCIPNNLDGGLSLSTLPFLYYYVEDNSEFLASLISTFDLKTYIISDDFKSSNPKYPDKKKELEKLASSLKETDNPVLMLVRLKK
jgi:hypothetical protein